MKINLTRLLDFSSKVKEVKKEDIGVETAALFVITNFESTSSDRAYSFELEKNTFSLNK